MRVIEENDTEMYLEIEQGDFPLTINAAGSKRIFIKMKEAECTSKTDKKPCIQCGNDCDIWPIMLGDTFTLTYSRLCGPECLFLEAYDFLYSICEHKSFRNHLFEKQDPDDRKARDEFIDLTTKGFLEDFGKSLAANPHLLSTPVPQGTLDMFKDCTPTPQCSGTMRFTRPSKEEKIKWAKEHVKRAQADLMQSQIDLEELLNER